MKELGVSHIKNTGKYKRKYYIYECQCGKLFSALRANVKNKWVKSCGCLSKRRSMNNGKTQISTFGMKFVSCFTGMKSRCSATPNTNSKHYGDRGIRCEWTNIQDFANDMYKSFCEHLEAYPGKETSLDRIDVNGNYNKENCRWATLLEQSKNKRCHLDKNEK